MLATRIQLVNQGALLPLEEAAKPKNGPTKAGLTTYELNLKVMIES